MSMQAKTSPHTIHVRQPEFDFDDTIPRYWFQDNPVITHNFNGYNLLFPEFERFFVRSVRFFKNQVNDPHLAEQILGFSGQEANHAQAHEGYFKVLRQQGYRIDTLLKYYKKYARFIERHSSPKLRLALTAAAEHYTATIAGIVLSTPALLEGMHPSMKKLVVWHSAEEVEHRSVAFDTLNAVNVSNFTRRIAFVMTSMDMLLWSTITSLMLLRQDKISLFKSLKYKRQYSKKFKGVNRHMRRSLLAYLKKDFHPSQFDYLEEAHQALKEVGIDA